MIRPRRSFKSVSYTHLDVYKRQLQGCTASTYQGVPIYCMVNPELGHEYELDYSKAPALKKLYIVGAGITGMEAARGAALRGHQVELFEKRNTVGGQFISASYPPYKEMCIRDRRDLRAGG